MKDVPGLDWLRGLAAILVMLSHARPFFFVNYPGYEGPRGPFIQLFYLLTGLGTSSVIVFFVLSGYLVAGSVERNWAAGRWSFSGYLITRLSRLWAVMLPCLALTFGLDLIGYHLLASRFYDGLLIDNMASGPSGAADWSFGTFLGNAFFLQTIIVPVFGSNGPLWSIANEFWYYMLFPMLFLAVHRPTRRIHHLLMATLIAWASGWEIMSLFPIWLAGFGAWHFRRSRASQILGANTALAVITVLLLAAGLVTVRTLGIQHEMTGYYLIGLLTVIAVPALHHRIFDTGAYLANWLSKLSYSLYLVHFPVLALIAAGYRNVQATTFYDGLPVFLVGLLSSFLAAAMVWCLFERRTAALKAWAESLRVRPSPGRME